MCSSCSCSTSTTPAAVEAAERVGDTTTYAVSGMTCSHCVSSVRDAVSGVAGVHQVDVDLVSGRLTVTGQDVSRRAVEAAVADAGYEVVSG